jgi:hypothetical protein
MQISELHTKSGQLYLLLTLVTLAAAGCTLSGLSSSDPSPSAFTCWREDGHLMCTSDSDHGVWSHCTKFPSSNSEGCNVDYVVYQCDSIGESNPCPRGAYSQRGSCYACKPKTVWHDLGQRTYKGGQ